ncbi:ribonuclease H2, subunit B [Amylocystis lapponica]|nr:ribonuclease H2, subunit B [Amylocystis lapponica]
MAYHVGILPEDVLHTLVRKLNETDDVKAGLQFVRLPHPRTGMPSLFLPYLSSKTGSSSILEVQAVAPPNPRSWFMTEGEIIEDGKLLLMTPIDPAFILIALFRSVHSEADSHGQFRTTDDLFDEVATKFMQAEMSVSQETPEGCTAKDILHFLSFDCTLNAVRRICETKDITPEITVYRYSPVKVEEYLKAKVARLAKAEVFEASRTLTRNLAKDGLMEDGKEALLESARVRAACDLVSQYITQDLYNALVASYEYVSQPLRLEDSPNDDRNALAALVAENMDKVEEKESKTTGAAADGKKRKAPKASFGVEKLKKANVKGMAKISNFFQKPAK